MRNYCQVHVTRMLCAGQRCIYEHVHVTCMVRECYVHVICMSLTNACCLHVICANPCTCHMHVRENRSSYEGVVTSELIFLIPIYIWVECVTSPSYTCVPQFVVK